MVKNIFFADLSGNDTDKIEFPAQGDKIMAATLFNGIPLLFSRLYGLVCITISDLDSTDFFNK